MCAVSRVAHAHKKFGVVPPVIQIGAGAAEHGHAEGKGGDQGEGDADSRLSPRPLRLHNVVAVGVIVLAGQADDARGGHGPQVGAHQHAHVVTQHPLDHQQQRYDENGEQHGQADEHARGRKIKVERGDGIQGYRGVGRAQEDAQQQGVCQHGASRADDAMMGRGQLHQAVHLTQIRPAQDPPGAKMGRKIHQTRKVQDVNQVGQLADAMGQQQDGDLQQPRADVSGDQRGVRHGHAGRSQTAARVQGAVVAGGHGADHGIHGHGQQQHGRDYISAHKALRVQPEGHGYTPAHLGRGVHPGIRARRGVKAGKPCPEHRGQDEEPRDADRRDHKRRHLHTPDPPRRPRPGHAFRGGRGVGRSSGGRASHWGRRVRTVHVERIASADVVRGGFGRMGAPGSPENNDRAAAARTRHLPQRERPDGQVRDCGPRANGVGKNYRADPLAAGSDPLSGHECARRLLSSEFYPDPSDAVR
ncbi:TPA_asm: UL9.5 [Human alphaherpesvirus 1]|nr:TPA_asm: UL9.5 [Human alphaherpesvirus 1]